MTGVPLAASENRSWGGPAMTKLPLPFLQHPKVEVVALQSGSKIGKIGNTPMGDVNKRLCPVEFTVRKPRPAER
jgi:hypothetical protein